MLSEPNADDTSGICVSCGLCCSGVLFDRARAEPEETERMKGLGLDLFADSKAERFRLPCPLLEGSACTIYEDRFAVCRRFECKLLKSAKAGAISVVEAQATIARAKTMIAGAAEADPGLGQAEARHRRFREGPPVGDAQRGRTFVELLALDHFLDRHFRNKPVERGFEELEPK